MSRDKVQYRSLTSKLETRSEPGEKKRIEGYFIVFNKETELWPGAFEEIAPESLDGALNEDIRVLINHETTLVLGRNKAGTATLKVDSYGLWASVEINEKDSDAMNLYARVERGDVDQCSFGFDITSENADWRDDGSVKWRILGINLYEISVVTFPAYETTSVQARHDEVEQHKQRKLEQSKQILRERLKKCLDN